MSTNTNANAAAALPATLGELRDSGYETASVRAEIRRNLIGKIRAEEPAFPGHHRL